MQIPAHDGHTYRILNIIDEFAKEPSMIRVARKLNSTDVVDTLTDFFILSDPPEYICSDNGSDFVAQLIRDGIGVVGTTNSRSLSDPINLDTHRYGWAMLRTGFDRNIQHVRFNKY
jgi:hypothetical protein